MIAIQQITVKDPVYELPELRGSEFRRAGIIEETEVGPAMLLEHYNYKQIYIVKISQQEKVHWDIWGRRLALEDVWGALYKNSQETAEVGMIVARPGQECPIWLDILPQGSFTVLCKQDLEAEVTYWLDYVQGAFEDNVTVEFREGTPQIKQSAQINCSVRKKAVEQDGFIALRSDFIA